MSDLREHLCWVSFVVLAFACSESTHQETETVSQPDGRAAFFMSVLCQEPVKVAVALRASDFEGSARSLLKLDQGLDQPMEVEETFNWIRASQGLSRSQQLHIANTICGWEWAELAWFKHLCSQRTEAEKDELTQAERARYAKLRASLPSSYYDQTLRDAISWLKHHNSLPYRSRVQSLQTLASTPRSTLRVQVREHYERLQGAGQ